MDYRGPVKKQYDEASSPESLRGYLPGPARNFEQDAEFAVSAGSANWKNNKKIMAQAGFYSDSGINLQRALVQHSETDSDSIHSPASNGVQTPGKINFGEFLLDEN